MFVYSPIGACKDPSWNLGVVSPFSGPRTISSCSLLWNAPFLSKSHLPLWGKGINTHSTIISRNFFVLKWNRSHLCRFPQAICLMLVLSLLMMPHHVLCHLWVMASGDSLKDCYCPSLSWPLDHSGSTRETESVGYVHIKRFIARDWLMQLWKLAKQVQNS